jgi:hypothetical protein
MACLEHQTIWFSRWLQVTSQLTPKFQQTEMNRCSLSADRILNGSLIFQITTFFIRWKTMLIKPSKHSVSVIKVNKSRHETWAIVRRIIRTHGHGTGDQGSNPNAHCVQSGSECRGIQRSGVKPAHSRPYSIEVKNRWSSTSILPYVYVAKCVISTRDKCTLMSYQVATVCNRGEALVQLAQRSQCLTDRWLQLLVACRVCPSVVSFCARFTLGMRFCSFRYVTVIYIIIN